LRSGVYVVDLDGAFLLRLADDDVQLSERFGAPLAVGTELGLDAIVAVRDLIGRAARRWRSRRWSSAIEPSACSSLRGPRAGPLEEFAAEAASALEMAAGYTDVVHAVRRRKQMNTDAKIQQNLLPPGSQRCRGTAWPLGCCPAMTSAVTSLTTPIIPTAVGWRSEMRSAKAMLRKPPWRPRISLCSTATK
jgi:hypothetical protein